MRILMFSVRPDEQRAVDEWKRRHRDVQVDTIADPLDLGTVGKVQGYDGIVVQQHKPIDDPKVYERLHGYGIRQLTLRITGYDIVDLEEAGRNDLMVTNVPAYSPRSVAELVLAQAMRLVRHLGVCADRESRGDYTWEGLEAQEIHNMTVGIIGAGKIGSAVARVFKALGARVIANDPVHRPELADTLDYVDVDTLLGEADIVTVHTPLDETTYHLVNTQTLGKMKRSAFLIDAARGPIVDTPALIEALQTDGIAGAALDSVEGEAGLFNADAGSIDAVGRVNPGLVELQAMPNVEVTPHIGFYTDAAVRNMVETALDDVVTVLEGRPCEHQVNS